ncbi:host cell division inhibitor Icd-like protein [Rosenbergiella nectarea subsp. apis]|nr:host cell division inhibitor Icd-like protein [Rosenbergiella nectarea subsp. apis]
MYRPIALSSNPLGLYHNTIGLYKETPPNSITSTERGLTTTVIKSNEEAMQENTTPAQGRHSLNLKTGNEQQSFIWIIAAVRRDCPTIKATIHHISAPTEREARQSLVKDHVCFFAGRINQAVSHV